MIKAFTHPDGSNYGWNCEQTYEYKIHCTGGETLEYPGYDNDTPSGDGDGGSGGSNGSSGGDDPAGLPDTGGGFVPDIPDDEEEGETVAEIIVNLDEKAKCIFDKLNQNSTTFVEAIKKFDGEFPVSHLKFSMDYTLPSSTNAVTNNTGTNFIEIKINGNTILSRTTLGLARTRAHETIHAELYRKVRSVGGQISINDFPGIYDYYRRHVKDWQHQQMAEHYRSTIVDILKEYDSNSHSDQFYNDLAWEGLHNTTAWSQESLTERTRITDAIIDFKNYGNKNCN